MSETFDVFLSYPHEEGEWVRRLVSALTERGLRVWYDETAIKPGESWIEGLQHGLRASTHFVFVITPKVAQSNWAAFELGAALGMKRSIIPIVAEDVSPDAIPGPARLRRYVLKTDPAVVADEIVRAIAGEREREKTPA